MCENMEIIEKYIVKIGMCDDDLENVKLVAKQLESEIINQNFNAEITLITDAQEKVFESVKNGDIDILFLDIDFKGKGKNGIDFAYELRLVNREFSLVFLSGHQRYMHVSFCVKVFDYIVKPINKTILEQLVSRFKQEYIINKSKFLTLNKWITVRIEDILYIEKDGNKCNVVTGFATYSTTINLNALLDRLPPYFIKCHRSYIANTKRIAAIDKKEQYIYFENGSKCPINSYFKL